VAFHTAIVYDIKLHTSIPRRAASLHPRTTSETETFQVATKSVGEGRERVVCSKHSMWNILFTGSLKGSTCTI